MLSTFQVDGIVLPAVSNSLSGKVISEFFVFGTSDPLPTSSWRGKNRRCGNFFLPPNRTAENHPFLPSPSGGQKFRREGQQFPFSSRTVFCRSQEPNPAPLRQDGWRRGSSSLFFKGSFMTFLPLKTLSPYSFSSFPSFLYCCRGRFS